MNWIPVMVSGESGIYSTLKENHKRGGNCSFWFTTFFMFNRHMGTDREELYLLTKAATKFQELIKL